MTIRDNKDYIRVLLYSCCTTIKGWGVLLRTTNSNRPAKAVACVGFTGIVSLEACKDQSAQGHGQNPGSSAVDWKYKKQKLSKQKPVTLVEQQSETPNSVGSWFSVKSFRDLGTRFDCSWLRKISSENPFRDASSAANAGALRLFAVGMKDLFAPS